MYLQNYHTERILIRPLTETDIPVWEQFFTDPAYTQHVHLPPQPELSTYQRAEFWVNKQLARYRENRYGLMALTLPETGELIGQCGLLTQEIDGELVTEIGYHLLIPFWGKGYATEAARFFKDLAFTTENADEVVSIIDIGNTPSEKVAARNGMKFLKTSTFWEHSVNVYNISKQTWLAAH